MNLHYRIGNCVDILLQSENTVCRLNDKLLQIGLLYYALLADVVFFPPFAFVIMTDGAVKERRVWEE